MKGFLGLANWYAIHIKHFAQHAAPLMESLKGKYSEARPQGQKGHKIKVKPENNNIQWAKGMEAGFEAIKQALVSDDVVVHIPVPGGAYRMHTDASDFAVGAVQEQEIPPGVWKVIVYFSRKLQNGQVNWSVREKETYALVTVLLTFEPWVGGGQVVVVNTDHQALLKWYREDLCTMSRPLGRRGRWHEFLSRFDIRLNYTKGEHNGLGDVRSTGAYPAGVREDTTMHGSAVSQEQLLLDEQNEADREARELRAYVQHGEEVAVRRLRADRGTHMSTEWEASRALYNSRQKANPPSETPPISSAAIFHITPASKADSLSSDTSPSWYLRRPQARLSRPVLETFNKCWRDQHSPSDKKDLPRWRRANKQERRDARHKLRTVPKLSWDRESLLIINAFLRKKLPPSVAVLYDDWAPHYQADPTTAPYGTYLEQEKFLHTQDYRLGMHNGKIHRDGRVWVPDGLLNKVIEAVHTYTHRGVSKTVEAFLRKFYTPLTQAALGDRAQKVVQGCTCATTKTRHGAHPYNRSPSGTSAILAAIPVASDVLPAHPACLKLHFCERVFSGNTRALSPCQRTHTPRTFYHPALPCPSHSRPSWLGFTEVPRLPFLSYTF